MTKPRLKAKDLAVLEDFDGKHVDEMETLAQRLPPSTATLRAALALLPGPHEIAATWLLKRVWEAGAEIDTRMTAQLVRRLPQLSRDFARLHVLQVLPGAPLSPGQAEKLHVTLLEILEVCTQKFVRAWAYNGLALVAVALPETREDCLERFAAATESESPSVRARIRAAAKSLR